MKGSIPNSCKTFRRKSFHEDRWKATGNSPVYGRCYETIRATGHQFGMKRKTIGSLSRAVANGGLFVRAELEMSRWYSQVS